jgi:hypothetical protein
VCICFISLDVPSIAWCCGSRSRARLLHTAAHSASPQCLALDSDSHLAPGASVGLLIEAKIVAARRVVSAAVEMRRVVSADPARSARLAGVAHRAWLWTSRSKRRDGAATAALWQTRPWLLDSGASSQLTSQISTANATSSSISKNGRDLPTLSPITSIALYTQRSSPVAIPGVRPTPSDWPTCTPSSRPTSANLIELAAGNFSRSGTSSGIHSDRSRSRPVIRETRRRVRELTGARDGLMEELQVVRYRPGQQFKPHHDSHSGFSIPPRRWTIFSTTC